jgi:hypothetical protein
MMARKFDTAAKSQFIECLIETGEPALAAKACGFSMATCQRHAQKDEEFAQAGFEALQAYRGTIAAEIHRRAIEGVEEDIFQGGIHVGSKRKYSDALLLAHAKRHMPNEYGDKKTITHNHTQSLDAASLTPESRELLRKLLELETPPEDPNAMP